jgi:hypothetical protein
MSVTRLTTNGLTGTKYDIASADNYYMEPIATTLLASNQTTITFSGIPNTYKHLQIRYINTTSTVNQNLIFRFNGDTGSNYAWHRLLGDGASAIADGVSATTGMNIGRSSTTSPSFAGGVFDILDYANTSKFKTSRTLYGNDQNGSGVIFFGSGLWQNTAAITSITITSAAGDFVTNSRFSLYGIKG